MPQKTKHKAARTPEERLERLQKSNHMEVQDISDLRQPRQTWGDQRQSDYTTETFTTYGTYQEPV